jgi:hypothetical protein
VTALTNSSSVVISSMDWILRSNLHPLQSLKADPYPMDLTYGQIHYRWIYRWIIQRFEVIRGCTPYFDKDSLLLRAALAPGAKAAREHGLGRPDPPGAGLAGSAKPSGTQPPIFLGKGAPSAPSK